MPSLVMMGILGALPGRFRQQSRPSCAVLAARWAFLVLSRAVLGLCWSLLGLRIPWGAPELFWVAIGITQGCLGTVWSLLDATSWVGPCAELPSLLELRPAQRVPDPPSWSVYLPLLVASLSDLPYLEGALQGRHEPL